MNFIQYCLKNSKNNNHPKVCEIFNLINKVIKLHNNMYVLFNLILIRNQK